jgi:hypothetical protein
VIAKRGQDGDIQGPCNVDAEASSMVCWSIVGNLSRSHDSHEQHDGVEVFVSVGLGA